jgi:uncharacterized membrane protein HdeD (DUF308 family)
MIRNRPVRRAIGVVLVVAGGLFMWFAPDSRAGLTLLVLGVVLELVGIALEQRSDEP